MTDNQRPTPTRNPEREAGLLTLEKPKVKRPPLYKVLLMNDDFTPMEFVVAILIKLFRKSQAEAIELMFAVHNEGAGVAGVFTREIAETKARQVMEIAKSNQHPLRCIVEKE